MSFLKIGEASYFSEQQIITEKEALSDQHIRDTFTKLAKTLKRVAPKSDEFLYAHAIIMHAAEACLIDQSTGQRIKNKNGKDVVGKFEEFVNKKGQKSLRWISEDGIKVFKNANGDIFPEAELIKAYKGWVGKPLCKDHISDSVDGIRGIIIDTHYDPKFKRVHALFALDKKNYGDLARKVQTGYANAVSMGTAVGRSVCTECGNVAANEKEYCNCVKTRNNYGEINLDLTPIELSLVVSGADHLAKVKNIIASMNNYVQDKQNRIDYLVNNRCVNPAELQNISDSIKDLQTKIQSLAYSCSDQSCSIKKDASETQQYRNYAETIKVLQDQVAMETDESKKAAIMKKISDLIDSLDISSESERDNIKTESVSRAWPPTDSSISMRESEGVHDIAKHIVPDGNSLANDFNEGGMFKGATEEISLLREKVLGLNKEIEELKQKVSKEEISMNSARLRARAKMRRAYWLGGGGINEPAPKEVKYEKEPLAEEARENDKQMNVVETGSEGLHPGDEETLTDAGRSGMNLKAKLEERKMNRRAYWQGGGGANEPAPKEVKYEKDPLAEECRNEKDRNMVGLYEMGDTKEIVPEDAEKKEKLSRAKLTAKFVKVLNNGKINKSASRWDIYSGEKLALSANGNEIYGDELDDNWDYLSSSQYGKDVIKHIRQDGFGRVAYLLKGAADLELPVQEDTAKPEQPVETAPVVEPVPELEKAPEVKEQDGVKEEVEKLLYEMEGLVEKLRDTVSGESELVNVEVDKKDSPMDEVLAKSNAMKDLYVLADQSADELALISEAFDKTSSDKMQKLYKYAKSAIEDAMSIFDGAKEVMECECKLVSDKAEKCDEEDEVVEEEEEKEEKKKASSKQAFLQARAQKREEMLAMAEQVAVDPGVVKKLVEKKLSQPADDGKCEEGCECDKCMDAANDDVFTAMKKEEPAMVVPDMQERKASRREMVVKAAEEILRKYELDLGEAVTVTEPTFFAAHPEGGTVTELSSKTPDAKVETIAEMHDAIKEVALKNPKEVKMAAVEIQEAIVTGKIKKDQLDKLAAAGAVDKDALEYWKKYLDQAPDAKEFTSQLVKDFSNKKKEASDDQYKIKLRRAYDIGLQAQEKGFIEPTRAALDMYVDDIMKFDDSAFESTKKIIARMSSSKKSTIPVVGTDPVSQPMTATASQEDSSNDLYSALFKLGWK